MPPLWNPPLSETTLWLPGRCASQMPTPVGGDYACLHRPYEDAVMSPVPTSPQPLTTPNPSLPYIFPPMSHPRLIPQGTGFRSPPWSPCIVRPSGTAGNSSQIWLRCSWFSPEIICGPGPSPWVPPSVCRCFWRNPRLLSHQHTIVL